MSAGKLVIKEYHYGGEDNAVITVLEGGEIMLEVDGLAISSTEDLHELAEWINEKAAEISTRFATGEFS